MDNNRKHKAEDREPLAPVGKMSRRTMVAGTVVTVAVSAILPLSSSAFAEGSDQDMLAFLVLSAALTGVDIPTLAPEFSRGSGDILSADPGIDPINVKNAYFDWIKINDARSSFPKLLQIAKDNRLSQNDIIAKVNASDVDTKSLARSIVLLWYLGSWYDPDVLKTAAASPGSVKGPLPQKVVSGKTYSQGLVWQIAGAHPMGYSNLQFGYWSRDPHDPNIVDIFSPAKFPL
jgi:hypothetical protein